MTMQEAINALEFNEAKYMIWDFDNCPIKEVNDLYVGEGNEEFVILAHKDHDYVVQRINDWDFMHKENDPIVKLSFHKEYYIYITFHLYPEDED